MTTTIHEANIRSDDHGVWVTLDGVKIATRGKLPDHINKWTSVKPGYGVYVDKTDVLSELVIEFEGARLPCDWNRLMNPTWEATP